MACNTEPTVIDFCRRRGDTYPVAFTLNDSAGVPIDITGFTFILTVDPESDPVDALNNLFSIAGVITDAVNGTFTITPTAPDADQIPDTYFYDLQQTDGLGAIRTIAVGQWQVVQDISK